MKRLLEIVAVAFLVAVSSTAVHAQAVPLVGTWKLNLEKSTFDPGARPQEPDADSRGGGRWGEIWIRGSQRRRKTGRVRFFGHF